MANQEIPTSNKAFLSQSPFSDHMAALHSSQGVPINKARRTWLKTSLRAPIRLLKNIIPIRMLTPIWCQKSSTYRRRTKGTRGRARTSTCRICRSRTNSSDPPPTSSLAKTHTCIARRIWAKLMKRIKVTQILTTALWGGKCSSQWTLCLIKQAREGAESMLTSSRLS